MSRWTEETPPAVLDLRLVPPALALWCGSLVGLIDATAGWWACTAAALAGVALGIGRTGSRTGIPSPTGVGPGAGRVRVRSLAGWLTALVFLAVGAANASGLHASRLGDPVFIAAQPGVPAVATLVVTGYPVAMSPVRGRAGPATLEEPPTRWRVSGRLEEARLPGRAWSTKMPITVFTTEPERGTITPGQHITGRGVLSPDDFGPLPALVFDLRGPVTVRGPPPPWHLVTADIRITLQQHAAALAADPAGLLPGLVLGDTSGIDDRLDADAKATGLAHLLAVSGSHFAILCGAAVLLFRQAGPRFAAISGGVVLVGLVLLVGPQPSVLRAAVMGGITVLALLTGRSRTALSALAAAVVALLLADPELALSAGFALSVQATAGLVLLAPIWTASLQRRGIPRGWADLVTIPVVAQLATTPVIAAISGAVSLVAVPANILATPVVAPALLLGVGCALVGPWWPEAATVLARAAEPLLSWVAGLAHTLARWPGAALPLPQGTAPILALTGLGISVLLLLRRRRARALVAAASTGVVLVLVPAQVASPGWPPPGWALIGCDVGQGDAVVLATGEAGTAVVVDAGPDAVLLDACLDRLAVSTVPLVVLTHLHADHIDGLAGVFDGRSVGAVAVGPGRDPPRAWLEVRDIAAAAGVPLVDLPAGATWASGALRLRVVGPTRTFRGTDSDVNNTSVVALAELGPLRVLLTGDIQLEAQRALLGSGTDLRAQVLKQPHHGSAAVLPEFLRAVDPSVAVIGVGAGNDYGHPAPAVLDMLAGLETETVLRTDEDGDVAVTMQDGLLATVRRGPDPAAARR